MKKIMIIEDDPIIAHIYRSRLEKEGFQVELCTDGQTGFYRIHEFKPEALLLDLMLPKMNGVQVLKKIRAEKEFGRIPILVFTNAYVPNMIQEAFGAGATQVFNKGTLSPRTIIDAIHKLLETGVLPPDPASESSRAPISAPAAAPTLRAPTLEPVPVAPPKPEPAPEPEPESEPEMSATSAALMATAGSSDFRFQEDLAKAFKQTAPDTLAALRKNMQDIIKAPDENARIESVFSLYRKVHLLCGSSGMAGFAAIAQMSAALEVLLKELHDKPKNINASTIRSVAHSIDFICELFKHPEAEATDSAPVNILVVDDEILSRRAITYALEKANLKSVSVEDPLVALNLSVETPFDLIFLDVQMPGLDGFDLCSKIRAGVLNKATPVIFVTSLTDFKSRAKSSLSGGTDLIAKPFMFIELGVKAITHVLRGRVNRRKVAHAA